jgi:hypothetical protein
MSTSIAEHLNPLDLSDEPPRSGEATELLGDEQLDGFARDALVATRHLSPFQRNTYLDLDDFGADPEEVLDNEIDTDDQDGDWDDIDYEEDEPSIPEESSVDVPLRDIARLGGRYYQREYDPYKNHGKPLVVGPACEELYPYLVTDPYPYKSMLESVELREMIASTTLAILDDADKFTTIVGEDTSGRIPALILAKAVNIIRERHGLPRARRLFVSGRISEDRVPHFESLGDDDHALVVTEYICSGGSVNNALHALNRVGFIKPSAVTLDRSVHRDNSVDTDTLYMGNTMSYTNRADSHLYGIDPMYKGVQKRSGDAHSTRAWLRRRERKKLVKARREFAHFAQELVDIWTICQETEAER